MKVLIWGLPLDKLRIVMEQLIEEGKLPYVFTVMTWKKGSPGDLWASEVGLPVLYEGYVMEVNEKMIETIAKKADYIVYGGDRYSGSPGKRILMMMKSLGKHGYMINNRKRKEGE